MQNITLDRKNRFHSSWFLYAKICMNKRMHALCECLRHKVHFGHDITPRPTGVCHALTGHRRTDCPELSHMFPNNLVFSIANLLHIICSSPLHLPTCDIQLWLIPLQGAWGGPKKHPSSTTRSSTGAKPHLPSEGGYFFSHISSSHTPLPRWLLRTTLSLS